MYPDDFHFYNVCICGAYMDSLTFSFIIHQSSAEFSDFFRVSVKNLRLLHWFSWFQLSSVPFIYRYECRTCRLVNGLGICSICVESCHQDHDIHYVDKGEFFCDCGTGDGPAPCQAMARNLASVTPGEEHRWKTDLWKEESAILILGINQRAK